MSYTMLSIIANDHMRCPPMLLTFFLPLHFLLYIERMILRKTGNAAVKMPNIVSSVIRYHSPLYE